MDLRRKNCLISLGVYINIYIHTYTHTYVRIYIYTIEANKRIINFLNVIFNRNRSTYQPFTKPNTSLQYVHRESNHPPITIKNIPAGINKRLSPLSSDKASFDQAALHTRKHSTKVDTTTHYSTNQPKQANGKTDNAITSSGTTLLLARTPAPTSDTNSSP